MLCWPRGLPKSPCAPRGSMFGREVGADAPGQTRRLRRREVDSAGHRDGVGELREIADAAALEKPSALMPSTPGENSGRKRRNGPGFGAEIERVAKIFMLLLRHQLVAHAIDDRSIDAASPAPSRSTGSGRCRAPAAERYRTGSVRDAD